MTPRRLYRTLLRAYGRQGWWPTTPPGALRPRYVPGRAFPTREAERLEVAVGAILTQNTAWTNVERALEQLHRARAVRVGALARERLPRLSRWIRSSGYFRQKALKLRVFARWVAERGGRVSALLEGPLPEARERLLSLWGVGSETADSILLYAGGRPIFVIDAYTLRIGRRLGWFGEREGYDSAQAFFHARLPRSAALYAEFHALLVELAKRHCRTRPDCEGCPARPGCAFGKRKP